jgi:hypothetical protein
MHITHLKILIINNFKSKGACPVLVGHRTIANKFIRILGETFCRPCGLKEDSNEEMKLEFNF